MRIGELLRERGWVEATSLDRAIAEQRHTGKRLCSLLVARGLLDPDEAARALGAQHEVAAALQRHLENRDHKLAHVIPPELGRLYCALPIGRGRNGELIVCVRDPRKEVITTLAQATGLTIMLAVAPASQLERLVEQTYGPQPHEEFDVDMTTGPIDLPLDIAPRPGLSLDIDPDPLSSSSLESGMFTLVGLDDSRVSKDPTQSGMMAPKAFAQGTTLPGPPIKLPPPPDTAVPVVSAASVNKIKSIDPAKLRGGDPEPQGPVPAPPTPPPEPIETPSLDETLVKLQRATTRDAATEIAMKFAIGRWSSSILLTIKEGVALGHRGHGALLPEDAINAITMPLATTSIIRSAHDARKLVTTPPTKGGAIQDRLTRLLGQPKQQAAAPIVVGQRIACVLVVGDARDHDNATTDMTLDLDDLTVALGSAYARIIHETKRG